MTSAAQLKSRSLYNPYHSKIAPLYKAADKKANKGAAIKSMVTLFKLHIKPVWALLLILSVVQWGFAAGTSPKSISDQKLPLSAEKAVLDRFDPLFEQVTLELSKNQQQYLNDPVAYHQFVNRALPINPK